MAKYDNLIYEPLIAKEEKKGEKNEKKQKEEKKGIFNKYRPRKEVGGWMLSSFLNPTYNKGIEKGFTLSNSTTTLGVISQCYGILTLAEYSKFDLDLGEYADACSKISAAYNYILSHIHADEDELIFDASSYFDSTTKDKLIIDDYTETIAVVLKCSVEIRRLLRNDLKNNRDTIQIDPKYLKQDFIGKFDAKDKNDTTRAELILVDRLIAKCMSDLTKSALTIKGGEDYYLKNSDKPLFDANGQRMLYKGWTFTGIDSDKHDRCEPSLYFTYLVSDAYLTFYESFAEAIDIMRRNVVDKIKEANSWLKKPDTAVESLDEDDEAFDEVAAAQAKTEEVIVVPVDQLDEEVSKADLNAYIANYVKENKKSMPTADVLDDLKFLQSNYKKYREFQKTIMDAGHYVDTSFSEFDTTRDFFSYNFKLVTAQSIEDSSSSDALFNVLFAINIMLAAGTDIDYNSNGRRDEFYESLQYTIPNIQRLYKKFLREGKESVCDQYILKFNEALPNDDSADPNSPFNQVKLLRKQRIFVYTLSPLVIKSYTTLSKYLTPYPQYEMRMYENEIVANKMMKGRDNKTVKALIKNPEQDIWLWDKDGFHIITNYNYSTALRMFYDYYETYEKSFVTAEEDYIKEHEAAVKRAEEALEDEIRKNRDRLVAQQESLDAKRAEEIAQVREEYEKEIDKYKAELRARDLQRAPVEDAIGNVVIKYYLENALTQLLQDCLDENRKVQGDNSGMNAIKSRERDSLNEVMRRLILSYFREGMRKITFFDITQNEENAATAEDKVFDALNQIISQAKNV